MEGDIRSSPNPVTLRLQGKKSVSLALWERVRNQCKNFPAQDCIQVGGEKIMWRCYALESLSGFWAAEGEDRACPLTLVLAISLMDLFGWGLFFFVSELPGLAILPDASCGLLCGAVLCQCSGSLRG